MSSWPSHLLAAGVLVWDESGRVLMVKTHNRDALILPGGIVESGESPAAAGQREVLEEVGLDDSVGRLLAVQHLTAIDGRPSSVQFVFDSEPIPASTVLRLQDDEIESAQWLHPTEAVERHGAQGRKRMSAAVAAHAGGPVVFLHC